MPASKNRCTNGWRNCCHHSVRRHLSQAYQRIGVRDRAQAIGWCIAHGLVTATDLQRIYRPSVPG